MDVFKIHMLTPAQFLKTVDATLFPAWSSILHYNGGASRK